MTDPFLLTGIDHVQLAMPPGEEDAADRFYAGMLGLELAARPPEMAARGGRWFRAPGLEVQFHATDPFGNRLEFIEGRG